MVVGSGEEINPWQTVLLWSPPRDPLTVGRPVVSLDLAVLILIDLRHRFRGNIDIKQSLQPIAPKQLLAIGRPQGLVIISVRAARHLLRLALAVLGADIELVLAGRVGVVSDPFSIWRPHRVAFMRVRRSGQIAWRALFCWDREKIAARHYNRAFAIGRQIHRLDMLGCIDQSRPSGGEVFLDLDRDRRGLPACQIVAPDVSPLLEDDRLFSDRWKFNVEVLEVRKLLRFL